MASYGIYIIFLVLLTGSLVFLAYPFLKGAKSGEYFQSQDMAVVKKQTREQDIKDKIESAKMALKDLDMENRIGKISSEDYEAIKDELLEEWQSAKNELGKNQSDE